MANSTYCKIHSSAIQLCNAAGEEVKKLKFTSALEFYTLGLLYAPATTSTNEQSKATKKLSETFESWLNFFSVYIYYATLFFSLHLNFSLGL